MKKQNKKPKKQRLEKASKLTLGMNKPLKTLRAQVKMIIRHSKQR